MSAEDFSRQTGNAAQKILCVFSSRVTKYGAKKAVVNVLL